MIVTTRPPLSVDIAVCTFRRPALRQTLSSLFGLSLPEGFRVRLIVADNDAEPTAQALVHEMRSASPFEIEYVHCPKSNISIARNACLSASRSDYLAFIDDDEVATPSWLRELVQTIRSIGADAVLGPVRAIYDTDAPGWMRRGDVHSTMPVWVSGVIRTGYTCNVILDMRSPHVAGRRFDLSLGQSGGEDTQFFSAMTDEGGRIAFAPGAFLDEPVPAARASFSWLAKRRFRSGQTHGRIIASKSAGSGRFAQSGLALGKSVYCTFAALMRAPMPVRRNQFILRAILHAGAVAGLLGMREVRQYGLVEVS